MSPYVLFFKHSCTYLSVLSLSCCLGDPPSSASTWGIFSFSPCGAQALGSLDFGSCRTGTQLVAAPRL